MNHRKQSLGVNNSRIFIENIRTVGVEGCNFYFTKEPKYYQIIVRNVDENDIQVTRKRNKKV